jgi:hypothetical protein
MLRDIAGIVNVIERATATGWSALGCQFRETPLVPELHGQSDDS